MPPMANPLKIGMILNEPPLAEKSAPARSHEAITHLIEANLNRAEGSPRDIDFKAFWMNSIDVAGDEKLCRSSFPSLASRFHFFDLHGHRSILEKVDNRLRPMAFHASSGMRAAVKKALETHEIDILHVEQAWMAYAVPRRFDPNRVLLSLQYLLATDFTAAPPAEGFVEKTRRWRLLQAELRMIRRFRHIRVLSHDMAESLRKLHPSAQIYVIPLAIDALAYQFAPRPANQSSPVVSVIGSMYWPPTRSAASRMVTRLWPAIHQAIPSARLQIVGRQAMQYFAEFQGQNNIEIHENVPNIEPYFHGSNALVYAPSAGSGMKVKVLEAMLQGLPVITNHSGIEGLRVEHGYDCLIAETDDEFIRQTIELLNNPTQAETIALQARALVKSQCDPQMIYHKTSDVYHKMAR